MRTLVSMGVWMLSMVAAGQALAAAPQDRYYGDNGGQTIRCESNDNKYRHCDVDTRGGVELVRGLSKTWCGSAGQNWGWDRNGVWVKNGCRAEFRTRVWGGNGGWNGGGNNGQTVRCESNDNKYRRCDADTRGGVMLVRGLSKTWCGSAGQNWGWDRSGIWVKNGCRAEFRTGVRGNGGWNGGNGNGGWNGGNDGQIVRCDSNDNRTQRCPANVRRGANLERQFSRNTCVEGRTWGWDRGAVWVSGGCRAQFRVW